MLHWKIESSWRLRGIQFYPKTKPGFCWKHLIGTELVSYVFVHKFRNILSYSNPPQHNLNSFVSAYAMPSVLLFDFNIWRTPTLPRKVLLENPEWFFFQKWLHHYEIDECFFQNKLQVFNFQLADFGEFFFVEPTIFVQFPVAFDTYEENE